MNISAEEFHIHFISYANIPFKAGIYASDLSIDWGDGTSSILKENNTSTSSITISKKDCFISKFQATGFQI